MDRPMRRSSLLMVMTLAVMGSPTLNLPTGVLIFSLLISETWTRPSMPSSSSTKMPKSVTLVMVPVISVPTR